MNKLSGLTLLVALTCAAAGAEAPEQVLKRAEQLEKEGKISRAVELYRSFLKAHPSHSQTLDAHYRLAKCLDALGYVDEVFEQLEIVVKSPNRRYGNRAAAFYMLGKLRASLKQYDEAAKVFERMLAEGAGLYEDEVLSLCAGYYAVQNKYDDAAAKLNILKRRRDSRYAEQAAYKLAVLWLRAENLDLAVEAVEDLAQRFPTNPQARGLMFQVADLFRRKRQFSKAIAACEQLKARFGKSREADAVAYVIGLCHRDSKQFDKAVAAFDSLARSLENRRNGIAAEGVLQSADILYGELGDPDRAMGRYEEAAKLAKDSQGERRQQVLEQCYFRLAEHHFSRKKWSVALEYYSLLRRVGTDINILPRILKCQAQLEEDLASAIDSDADVAYIKQKIQENAGTFAAAEGEVFLLDRELHEAIQRKRPAQGLVPKYQEVLKKYPPSVLSQQSLESYIYAQLGVCHAHGGTKEQLAQAIAMYEKGLAVDPATPYATEILEGVAAVADAVGDNDKSFATYKRLFELAAAKVEKGTADDATREGLSEYLRGMLTRAERKSSIAEAVAVAQGIIEKKGPFSEAARYAMFYLGDLHYLRKDFSTAAKTYRQYIKAYGPQLNAAGDVADPPWKPAKVDEKTLQVYEAAVRVAHC
ncbi:MAG: tetratricopeptide repeat protein, partial [Phycisphaerae bacterium]